MSYVTDNQKRALVKLVTLNPQIFSPNFTRKDAEKLWSSISKDLNNIPGPKKEWKVWRKTWQDMCIRTRQKMASHKKGASNTDDSTSVMAPLTDVEEQISQLLLSVSDGSDIPQPAVSFQINQEYEISEQSIGVDEEDQPVQDQFTILPDVGIKIESSEVTNPIRVTRKRRRNKTSISKAYSEHREYLKEKLEITRSYYAEKVKHMERQSVAFENISAALQMLAEKMLKKES